MQRDVPRFDDYKATQVPDWRDLRSIEPRVVAWSRVADIIRSEIGTCGSTKEHPQKSLGLTQHDEIKS